MAKEAQGRLRQKLGQNLSTWQIQLMQLVALPQAELAERVKQELIDNPALEEGHPESEASEQEIAYDDSESDHLTATEIDMGDYADEDDIPTSTLQRYNNERKSAAEIPFASEPTLREHLIEQLRLTKLNNEEQEIATFIIGSLEDDGYLRRTLEGIADDLAIYQGIYIDPKDLQPLLHVIQTLDPAGIGARSLEECLLLQLERHPDSKAKELAIWIIQHQFEALGKKQLAQIEAASGASVTELKEATALIASLNPTPGLDMSNSLQEGFLTVIPDFQVTQVDGELVVTLLNGDIPEVRVSRTFEEQMQSYTNKKQPSKSDQEASHFARKKIEGARWFVDLIKQRNNTMLTVMMALVSYQHDYFLTGEIHTLRPMILKDIAEQTGFDISTISRVTSTKYAETDFGIIALKQLFSEGTLRDDGTAISTHIIRQHLTELIAAEDKQAPLSDEELSKKLQAEGYNVARRTIAKYRDMLNIPIARLRKEW